MTRRAPTISSIPKIKRKLAAGKPMSMDSKDLLDITLASPSLLDDYFRSCLTPSSWTNDIGCVLDFLRSDLPDQSALILARSFTKAAPQKNLESILGDVLMCFLPRPQVNDELVSHLASLSPGQINLSDKLIRCLPELDYLTAYHTISQDQMSDLLVGQFSVLSKHGHGLSRTSAVAPSPLVRLCMLFEQIGSLESNPKMVGACLDGVGQVWEDFRQDLTDPRISEPYQKFLLSRPFVRQALLSDVAANKVDETPTPSSRFPRF